MSASETAVADSNVAPPAPGGGQGAAQFRRWAFALVPLIGLWELGAHLVQTHSVVTAGEWGAAKTSVEGEWKKGDLVVFAPYWADPLGREYFGDALAPLADEARPDESRYGRAFEVSMRGEHAPELADWKRTEKRKVGPFTISVLENPAPGGGAHVLDDLVAHATPDRAHVFRMDRGTECLFTRGGATAGGLGSGPAIPGNRFACNGGNFVGESVIFDRSYRPRRCLFAPPAGRNIVTRIVFQDVPFGSALHGHAGLQYESENGGGSDTVLTWRVGDQTLGRIVHRDGEGWKAFELETAELQGKRGDLVAEIATAGNGRQYCFEADTRVSGTGGAGGP